MANTLHYFEKILPTQRPLSDLYAGAQSTYPEALFSSILGSCAIETTEQRFKLTLTDKFSIAEMGSSPLQLRILEFLTALSGAKVVLEIGSFIGVSAMAIASALPADGHIVTIEKFDHFAEIAQRNFSNNGLAGKITLHLGDAFDIVPAMPKSRRFDMVFVDGNKERYADYFEMAVERLAPGGLIVVDDVFFHGDAINERPTTEKGRGVKTFLETAAERADFFKVTLPVANGLMLLLHRG